MSKIYLMCPYNHGDPLVRNARFDSANLAAGKLIEDGHIVFSPISMSHPIAIECNMGLDFDAWEAQDVEFMDWADLGIVLKIPGWHESKGVLAEIEYMTAQGMPIQFMEPV